MLAVLLTSFSVGAPRTACLRGDCVDGVGAFRWADGDSYSGSFKAGKPDGLGVFRADVGKATQQRYAGAWSLGVRQGAGVLIFNDGRTYRGEFAKGKMEGYGVQSWTGEHRVARGYDTIAQPGQFEGSFLDGVWSGKGRITRGVKHPETGEDVSLSDEGVYLKGKLLSAEDVPVAVETANAAAKMGEAQAKAAREAARSANTLPLLAHSSATEGEYEL